MKFLFVCSVSPLNEFRIPELDSIAALFGFPISYPEGVDITRPYLVVELPSEKEARLIGTRAILVKNIWRYWASADTYEQLHELVKAPEQRVHWEAASTDTQLTWAFSVNTYGHAITVPQRVAVIESFSYLAFPGPIKIKNPELEVGVFEEYHALSVGAPGEPTPKKGERGRDLESVRRVWVGTRVCEAQRGLMDTFDLKKRKYIGTTSMNAEVSLVMANQALAAPGKIVYDPFAGTGSMLLTASAFGAYSFGSDIDGRQLRGKGTNISSSAVQYGVLPRIIDTPSFDLTQHPFRCGELFDAIITDPPYGVRAGAKRLGRKEGDRAVEPTVVPGREGEGFHHQFPDYVPPSVPWEMTEVINNLITYSLYLLKPGGRLVFFLPTDNAEYKDVDIPVVPGLRLISNSSEDFGKWARRLITMEKVGRTSDAVIAGLDRGILRRGVPDPMEPRALAALQLSEAAGALSLGEGEGAGEGERKPGHAAFAERYKNKFGGSS